ncbi:MAG: gliding motility-associated ABC transporter ATP-binding subunit GldA [Chryseolinea sp.]
MSLQIQHVTKQYDQQKAVDDISFDVKEGEIVGFLGPNGAGKSTTMKMATCFLPPTSGSVIVAGYNVMDNPMEVKKVTGYLPEHNPLYLDLYVHEYLEFIGGLYSIKGKALKSRVGEMIERCGLTREQNKKIESLSKGYRQRIGLAQALLHDPKVLILDEPTSGLDPNQLIEIRKLIKEVSKNKTVIFSTHIMQEVQALCDRVVVINKGKIVADDSLQNLLQRNDAGVSIMVEFEGNVEANELSVLKGVIRVQELSKGKFSVTATSGVDIRPELFRFAADKNLSLIGLKQEEASLESIFRDLTVAPTPMENEL